MENGVGNVDGSYLGEKRDVIDEVLESRVEERTACASDDMKDSEGEEVFAMAMETEMPRVDSKDVILNEDGNGEKVENPASSLGVDERSNEVEVENFEEAIGIPSETATVKVIDEQIAIEKVVRDELNGLRNDELVGNEENGGNDVADVGGIDDTEISQDGDLVDESSGEVLEKSEKGISVNENLKRGLVHDNSESRDTNDEVAYVHAVPENGDANEVGAVNCNSHQKVESNGELLHQSEEVKETLSNLDIVHQDDKSEELEDTSAGLYSKQQGDKVEEPKDNLIHFDMVLKDDSYEEPKEGASASLGQGHLDLTFEELKDTSSNLDMESQDDAISKKKDNSASINSVHHVESHKPEDNLCASVEERTITVDTKSLPSLEDSVADNSVKIQPSVSDSGAENCEGSQSQHADETVEVSNAVSKDSEQKRQKDEEVKQSIQGNRDQEIKSAADISSSSGKSTNPAPVPARPAGLGRAAPLLEPAPRVVQQNRVNGTATQMQNQLIEDPTNGETEENDETREKLQMIRVKFLRLAHRLGQTPHNVVVAQVLYRLGLAEQLRGRTGGRVAAFSFDRASAMAEQLEAAGQEPLDFSCTIMVLGKTGVGKSATINSIFDEVKFGTDAFQSGTKKVQDVVGTVQGIKVRVIDTPGLLPSWSDQRQNEKILHSVKRFIKKTPPDIVLYLDRLDMQSRDFCDMPLLRTITDIFGPSIWFNAIVVLTHAASAPPEGPNGTATSYDMFVTQRSHVVQQAIRQAAGDMRLMNPVSLVENHSACRTNRAGQRVLPNGQVWKPHLLLLSFASKILAEANTLLKLQDSPPGKPFATRTRAPPLPFLLSSLLQSRPQLKLPEEQFADDDNLDDDLDESSDSDTESEYDELPPFKRLTKAQLAKLNKAQRKAYYDELEYREKLFMKKQLKEEKKRRKMMKEMAAAVKDLPSDYRENVEEESGAASSVPVPMPDLPLPASFDSENPTHRYRYLDSSNQWLVRPDLEPHGWDHDVGYDGISVERLFVVKDKIPVSFSGQVTKDKKDANLHMELASSVKHGKGKATSLGIDMQTVGKDIAYTVRSETRFSNYRQNKATAGISATVLGDALTAGVKVEDKLIVKKRLHVVMSGGAVAGRGDVAYGGSLEATLRDRDHPLGRSLSTFGLSIMDWHGDLAIGWNIQSQIPVGRFTNLIGRINVNNRGTGQVSIRLNSSEQLQIALIGLIPLLRKVLGYPQELQFGQR
ncbi:translocase of chloroplast 120, chloroplastic-like [Cornus florida]|uniref:translocase of chloroplast 120, chloroplastic-like n=1 Tax=Cornus florida TaxID=4283 RepID=UPI002897B836|nr:translocase of chloroplast 120, chloroplastic-like [Cornus florida]